MRPRHQATLMQPLQCDLQIPNCKTQKNYAQRREKLQLQNRMDLGTKPKKKTIHAAITMRFASRTLRENWAEYARNDPNRTRRTHEVPFHRRLQPLDTEKHKVLCSGFLPKTNPIQQSCSHHYNAFCGNTITTILPPQGVKNVTYMFGVPLCRVLWPWLYTTYIHIYVGCLIRSHKVNAQILHYIFRPGKQIYKSSL